MSGVSPGTRTTWTVVVGAVVLLSTAVCHAQSRAARCGEAVTLPAHGGTTTRYAFSPPRANAEGGPITLVLLPGGPGDVNLDDAGCVRALHGNSLVRSIPIFGAAGFGTALVDAPSDHHGGDGLGGFRTAPEHADDLGKVIADVRARTQGVVWVVGTSRGAISAVNAASRLSGPAAPDGIVITSALMVGQSGTRKSFVSRSVRTQIVTVTGGPGTPRPGVDPCEGRSPHGYIDQEDEVAAGIARFVRGGTY